MGDEKRTVRKQGRAVVIGEHNGNVRALAKAAGKPIPQQMPVLELGEGFVVAGFQIQPLMRPASDEEGAPLVLVAGLVAMAGKSSPLALSVELRPVLLGELGGIPVEALKRALTAGETPATEAEPQ